MRSSHLGLGLVWMMVVVGCGADAATPFGGVLHPADSGDVDTSDAAQSTVDAANMSDATTEDAQIADAGTDAEPDTGVDAGPISPLEGTEPTNMPNAVVQYGGTELSPGLTFLGTHLEIDDISTGLSVDFYARVRNDFSDTLCSFAVNVDLFDDNGTLLARRLRTLGDLEPHNGNLGLTDCVSPGDIFYLYATDFIDNAAGTVTLEDVAVVEWTYSLGGYLDSYPLANRATAENLAVAPSDYDTFVLTGRITNNTGSALGYPSIVAYVLNAGDQPLDRLVDITSAPISAYGSWDFETGLYRYAFTVADIEYLISYQAP